MQIETFVEETRRDLASVLERRGKILYSAARTLSPGKLYFLGLNPGGTDSSVTISSHLASLPTRVENAYEEEWDSTRTHYAAGAAPLQRRIKYLFEDILGCPLTDVCATNLIFMQTHDAGELRFQQDAATCWPVHQRMLGIIQPKVIVAFGNSGLSPYAFLRQQLSSSPDEVIPSGHGTWKCRSFDGVMNDNQVTVVGLPHMSRYSPVKREGVAEWLREKAGLTQAELA